MDTDQPIPDNLSRIIGLICPPQSQHGPKGPLGTLDLYLEMAPPVFGQSTGMSARQNEADPVVWNRGKARDNTPNPVKILNFG